MGKHLTKTGIAGYDLLLAVASISIWSLSCARFTAQESGMATVTVVAWSSGSSTININVSELRPGSKKTYTFEVTNTENGVVSEVGQDYSVIVETTGNLPLDFALTYNNSNPGHQGLFVNMGENGISISNDETTAVRDDRLPHSVSAIHTYTPAISWSKDKTGTEYADEIDLVTLTISSGQAVSAIQEQEASNDEQNPQETAGGGSYVDYCCEDYVISGRHSGYTLYGTGKPEWSCGGTDILLYQ